MTHSVIASSIEFPLLDDGIFGSSATGWHFRQLDDAVITGGATSTKGAPVTAIGTRIGASTRSDVSHGMQPVRVLHGIPWITSGGVER